jgi:CspA family cold shock protein
MIRGRLKTWIGSKGYGFLARDDGRKDVFLYHRCVEACGIELAALEAGAEVEFDTELDRQGRLRVAWLRLVEPAGQEADA